MSRRCQRNEKPEGPLISFLMGQLAAALFAVPTAALLWFATNKQLALWGPGGAFIGATGFWLILACFAFVSLFIPRFFPSLLGKVWNGIIRIEQWF
ncbi:hypothetical protein [Amphritea japonica]|uniref:Uncharacterized protein n=1 Tax=Amphritea japonica ATCC BAA-1530 TaxID=1278309 RepID=A0A7R6P9S1_9GAMM|nr:hypothetical protein [Amphritea japonica]BBB26032.1 conserved hypothetical protein [Amphritea japonica ATCC BAA-1530]